MPERRGGGLSGTHDQTLLTGSGNVRNPTAANRHPTVKSVALMAWLCRLACPAGGVVLDPFAGSGSTGVAALGEGLRFVGVEREAEYAAICRARLAHAEEKVGRS